MPLSWKSQRCAYLPCFCKVEHTGITGVYIFSTPPPLSWLMNHLFFVSFCFGQSVSAKGIFSLASVKIPFVFFCACVCGVFPPRCGNSFLFKAGGEAKQPGPVSQTKKNTHLGKKKVKVLPLRHTVRDDDHTDDVNLHLKLTACVITLSR